MLVAIVDCETGSSQAAIDRFGDGKRTPFLPVHPFRVRRPGPFGIEPPHWYAGIAKRSAKATPSTSPTNGRDPATKRSWRSPSAALGWYCALSALMQASSNGCSCRVCSAWSGIGPSRDIDHVVGATGSPRMGEAYKGRFSGCGSAPRFRFYLGNPGDWRQKSEIREAS